MRLLALQLVAVTALLAWRLRRRGGSRRAEALVLAAGGLISLASLPHTLFGWQVQQHVAAAFLLPQMALAAAWFFGAAAVALGLWAWDALSARRARPAEVDPGRRRLLAQAPLALGLVAPAGLAGGAREPELTPIRVVCAGLPAGFSGLRILQISDLHLGPCLGLDWLERALERAVTSRPDLVAITGDLSNDLELMGPALRRLRAIAAPLGHYAIPGNHEHYVGVERYDAEVSAAGVTLLTGAATTLSRNGATLQLLGIDYPNSRREKGTVQFTRMITAALAKASPGYRLLLSHHPGAFEVAPGLGIGFTLSGHTHGGQIAPFGWSPLAPLLKYPRGLYQDGDARMYVTTGLGHWLPFRIDCPTELPIIELVAG